MRRSMNRIVLALLALFAGIAAQVSPAEARVRGETEIGSVLAHRAAARACTSVEVAAAFRAPARFEPGPTRISIHSLPPAAPAVPTVLLGPDRARE
jgi:hypothetical protein